MSHPNQNNPYGPPEGQPQPGLPQQGGQGFVPYPDGPGQPPMMPLRAPGTVTAARVLLFVIGGFGILLGLLMLLASAALSSGSVKKANVDTGGLTAGLVLTVALLFLVFSIGSIVVASMFGSGGNAIRVAAIVLGSVFIALGVTNIIGGNPLSFINVVIGVLIVVFCAKGDAKAWFTRRHHEARH